MGKGGNFVIVKSGVGGGEKGSKRKREGKERCYGRRLGWGNVRGREGGKGGDRDGGKERGETGGIEEGKEEGGGY